MASKILFISLNGCTIPDPVFPLGLAYLNAALRREGHDTRWIDFQIDRPRWEAVLREYGPDFVGISLRNIDDVLIQKKETYFNGLATVCATIRTTSSCPIILGGGGFSIFPERLLELSGADFGIRGEGERSLVLLIRALEKSIPYEAIPGLVYRQGNRIGANPPHTAPTREVFLGAEDRPEPLRRHYLQTSGTLNVQTQRGCGHACCYCTYPLIEGKRFRRCPPEQVAEEFAQLQACGAKQVFIVDSLFNSSVDHVVETCEALLQLKHSVRWSCFLRPQGLTPELLKLMARAGLTHIEFGSDSFCDTVLASYGKQFTFEDIYQASEWARQEGVAYCHFLVCGGPGETAATLNQSFENSQRLRDAVILAVAGMRIYPGTPLNQTALREGVIAADTDLLQPAYYLAPNLTAEAVFGLLRQFSRQSPNWIVGDPAPAYAQLVERLRRRGIFGPLWSYFAMLQRIQPQSLMATS